jgi:hypothetical protein
VRFFLILIFGLICVINIKSWDRRKILMLAVVFAFISDLPVASGQIKGSTEFQYETTDAEGGDAFLERYTLSHGGTFSEALSYNAGFNAIIDSLSGERSRQEITPSIFLSLDNLDMSGSLGFTSARNENRSGRGLTNNTFFLTLTPHLLEKYFSFSSNYTRRSAFDDLSPRRIDTTDDSWRFALEHDLPLPFMDKMSFSYTFNIDNSKDGISQLEEKGTNGTLGIRFSKEIANRIGISGSLDLNRDRSTFSVPQAPFISTFTPFGLWSVDFSPTTGRLNDLPALVDGDSLSASGVSLLQSDNNIGTDLAVARQTSLIYINMQAGFRDESLEVQWEVYRSDDGENWSLVTNNPDTFFNFARSRYEIGFPQQLTRFIKVVNVTVSSELQADVTELDALVLIPGLPGITETVQRELNSGINFSTTISKDISLSGSAFYTVIQQAPQNSENTTTSFSGSIGYQPSKLLGVHFSASNNGLREFSSVERTSSVTNSYTLGITSQVLDLVRPSISLGLTEGHDDKELTSRTKSGAINLFFLNELYPGVEIGTNALISETENFNPGAVELNYGTNFEINLRPKSWISLANRYSVIWSREEIGSSAETVAKTESMTSSLSLSPSSSFHLSGNFDWTKGSIFSSVNVTWLQTAKMQISTTYQSRSESGDETSRNLTANLSWRIKPNVTLTASWNFEFNSGAAETVKSFKLGLVTFF